MTVPGARGWGTVLWLRACAGRAGARAGGPTRLCSLVPSHRASWGPTALPLRNPWRAVQWGGSLQSPGCAVPALGVPSRQPLARCPLVLWRPELSRQTSRAARGWPLLSRLPGSQLPRGAPGACLQMEGPGPHRPDALPTHGLSSRVHPRALVVRGQRLRLRAPWPHAHPGGAGVQAAPGVGMRPQLPAASWESGWDEQSAFAAPPPHPNFVGAAGPSPPWLSGPLCPGAGVPSAGHGPAACCICGGGSVERAASVEAGGPGSAPNPGSPLPTASASLERASRARVGLGEHEPRCSQAVGGSELEPTGSAGKAVGVASDSIWLGAGAGSEGPPRHMLTWARP